MNLKKHNRTKTIINALEYRVKTLHPNVSNVWILPAIPASLLESKPGIQPALTHPRLSLRLSKFWGLGAAGLPELPGLESLESPESQTCSVVLESLFDMRHPWCDSIY